MRTTRSRAIAGLFFTGLAVGAAVGIARPSDPPTTIPAATDEPQQVPELPMVRLKSGQIIPVAGQSTPVTAVAPTVKNDPAIALDWSGPSVVKVGKPAEYTLHVRNMCGQALQKVVVQLRAPKGVTVSDASPASTPTDGVYLWELGTLDVKDTKTVKVTLTQPTKDDLTCQAWVTFTGTSAMKATVREPKLAVAIKAPESVILGDKIPIEYAVSNSGDYPAENVVVKLTNSALQTPVGVELKAGGSLKRNEEFIPTSGGTFTYEAVATGADGLKATAKATVKVLVPKLDVSIVGPADRLIGKKATYTVTVRNSGDVPVTGVVVREHVPAAFRVVSTGSNGVLAPAGDRVSWTIGDLAVGAVKELSFEGTCAQPGTLSHHAEATGDRNTKAAADYTTKVAGIPALRMEMVDAVDPVEKSGETVYEIKVTNTGTQSDADVKIVCEVPKEFEFVSSTGPTKGRNDAKARTVTFEPINELAPKTEAVFKVKVKAITTGDVRFKSVMTSKHLTAPVVKEESTRVYGE